MTLKPCPFCGFGAAFVPEFPRTDKPLGYIECPNCGGRTGGDLDFYEDAKRKWNTRKGESK